MIKEENSTEEREKLFHYLYNTYGETNIDAVIEYHIKNNIIDGKE